jgi:hypothetical protein
MEFFGFVLFNKTFEKITLKNSSSAQFLLLGYIYQLNSTEFVKQTLFLFPLFCSLDLYFQSSI